MYYRCRFNFANDVLSQMKKKNDVCRFVFMDWVSKNTGWSTVIFICI